MITLQLKNPEYNIHVGESYKNLTDYLPDKQTVIITDKNVFSFYEDFINQYNHIIISTGEKIKTWSSVSKIASQLLSFQSDRHTHLVGFGGGIVGDITGFVSSIFMRGISFSLVPTTLLAQVDASIGGKTGINFQKFKNMLGVFKTPEFVLCDPNFLKTLNKKEIRSGFAEVIKHALIKDFDLFNYLSANYNDLLSLSSSYLSHIILKSINIKANIVQQDFKEKGLRKILNFGHTLGHAIENNSSLTHGESIAIGMYFAANLSVKHKLLKINELKKIKELLEKFNLPLKSNISLKKIIQFMRKDKKKNMNKIDYILLESIGSSTIKELEISELENEIISIFKS